LTLNLKNKGAAMIESKKDYIHLETKAFSAGNLDTLRIDTKDWNVLFDKSLKYSYLTLNDKMMVTELPFRFEPMALKSIINYEATEKAKTYIANKTFKNKSLHRMIKSHFFSIDQNAYALAQLSNYFKAVGKSNRNVTKEKAHGFGEMAQIVYEIINSNIESHVEGEVFEFGCFTGIGTAKLSIASNFIGKKLYTFDSFQGLPGEHYFEGEQKTIYCEKDYCASKDLVERNIALHGIPDDVVLIEGYFSNSLETFFKKNEDIKIAACFIDVDIAKSIDECLDFVIPRLSPGSILAMHEYNDQDNFKTLQKHNLFNSELYEIYTVNHNGDISEDLNSNLYGCGILRKK
tara:strand:+ start:12878 stop:13918 length:1041 start_codon:yes stop_codon:yes gene_type:complete